jgi:hypothetical protein
VSFIDGEVSLFIAQPPITARSFGTVELVEIQGETSRYVYIGGVLADGSATAIIEHGTNGAFFGEGSFGSPASLATARSRHRSVVLDDLAAPTILVMGGQSGDGQALASVERLLVDGETASVAVESAPSMAHARLGFTATLLPNGEVLVIGGLGDELSPSTAELFDGEAWTAAGALATPRHDHTATLLPDGSVVVIGGFAGDQAVGVTEVWEPTLRDFRVVTSMNDARGAHTATLLTDGRVVVVGGRDGPAGPAVAVTETLDLFRRPQLAPIDLAARGLDDITCTSAAVSDDGRYAALRCTDVPLPGIEDDDDPLTFDILVADRAFEPALVTCASCVDGVALHVDEGADDPLHLSQDGRHVAVVTAAALTTPDGNGARDVYLYDRELDRHFLMSGEDVNGDGSTDPLGIFDGTGVALAGTGSSVAVAFVGARANDPGPQVYASQRGVGEVPFLMLATTNDGSPLVEATYGPSLSLVLLPNGFIYRVAFRSDAFAEPGQLVGYVSDAGGFELTMANVAPSGLTDVVLAPDGNSVAFWTDSSLVQEDVDTEPDLYVGSVPQEVATRITPPGTHCVLDGVPPCQRPWFASSGRLVFLADETLMLADPGEAPQALSGSDVQILVRTVSLAHSGAFAAFTTEFGGFIGPPLSSDVERAWVADLEALLGPTGGAGGKGRPDPG